MLFETHSPRAAYRTLFVVSGHVDHGSHDLLFVGDGGNGEGEGQPAAKIRVRKLSQPIVTVISVTDIVAILVSHYETATTVLIVNESHSIVYNERAIFLRKGRLTASWKRGAGISGYQLQYGLKADFSDGRKVKISKATTLRRTIKNLKKGKAYYVRIRAYKKTGGKSYWSAWSAAKKIKVRQ